MDRLSTAASPSPLSLAQQQQNDLPAAPSVSSGGGGGGGGGGMVSPSPSEQDSLVAEAETAISIKRQSAAANHNPPLSASAAAPPLSPMVASLDANGTARFTTAGAHPQPQGARLSIETVRRRQSLTQQSSLVPQPSSSTAGAPAAAPAANNVAEPTGMRRSKSLSFFIDITSPMSAASFSESLPGRGDEERPSSPAKRARVEANGLCEPSPSEMDWVVSQPAPPSFPPFVRERGTAAEIYRRMTQRLLRAQASRESVLYDRRARLRRRFEQIRYRMLLQRQRERLTSLKIQARTDYAISAANLKRHLILKKNIDRCGAAVEHAHTVAMAQKLRKFMELRRSFSENFVELLAESQALGGGGAGVMQAMGLGIHRGPLAMIDMDESPIPHEEEYLMDEVHYPSVSPTFSASPSSSNGKHVSLAALRGGVSAAISSGSGARENSMATEEVQAQPAEPLSGDSSRMLTDDDGYASSGGGAGASANSYGQAGHPEDINGIDQFGFGDLDASASEGLAATIRRLRVLPVALLEEMDEKDYLELLSLLPPITRFTLRELELSEILSNAQLRHDLYFDPELQFKPNLDGEKGDQKKEAGDLYWIEVEDEVLHGHLWRLPLLLFEIRSIIIELLPYNKDRREEVDRNLDISLVAQQIEHGVLNALGLVTYLADLLKANCAPARDELVDGMVEECRGGNMVRTLRQCFEVLELMKLDYANHQLHRVRPYVVEHAAEFEWRWFKDQYELGTVKLDDTMRWMGLALNRRATVKPAAGASLPPLNIQHLHTSAVLHLISQAHLLSLPTTAVPLPETLRMDVSRLVQYYNDWQDVTIMAALLVLFKQACAPKPCRPDQLDSIKRVLWVLLNDHETSMTHVTLQMCKTAGDIRGKPFEPKETTMLTNLVESTLQPESKLYEIIRTRVGTVVERLVLAGSSKPAPAAAASTATTPSTAEGSPSVASPPPPPPPVAAPAPAPVLAAGPPVTKADLAKVGLAELEEEVFELGDRVRRLVAHNWTVFAGVYAGVVDGINDNRKDGDISAVDKVLRAKDEPTQPPA
ncbi:hypothetical protein HDU87_008248 [Geranomyces variabilis]|uniref:Uncharacterized protein n=1 Tax=Geranomyces variabilis TaxID=109894 RepID=A0AAD5TDT7_9FUNG|nr:hypothetical protein HDU87_008248 [Geranomyces variabilis]